MFGLIRSFPKVYYPILSYCQLVVGEIADAVFAAAMLSFLPSGANDLRQCHISKASLQFQSVETLSRSEIAVYQHFACCWNNLMHIRNKIKHFSF